MGPEDGPPRFDRWLQNLGITQVYYNARDMQSVGSDVCGLYACYFLKHGLPQQNQLASLAVPVVECEAE